MFRFLCSCVDWPPNDIDTEGGLSDMIQDARDITRRTFLLHVDRDELRNVEQSLSYSEHPSQGMTMAGDWHVSYHRSKLHGRTVYYFRHSAIEYVFDKM